MDVAVKDTSFCAYLCLYTGIMYVSICNMECTACVCVCLCFFWAAWGLGCISGSEYGTMHLACLMKSRDRMERTMVIAALHECHSCNQ